MRLDWKYVKIGDVCTVERGGSPRPIDQYITNSPDGINWIKIGDTSDSMYITATEQKIIPEGMKKSRYVKPGDFLLSNSMSFGRPYILKIDGCIHDGWLVIRDDNNLYDKRFLYYYLSAPTTYEKFKGMAVGGVVNNLNSDMVRGVSIPLPIKNEQCEIADTLDKVTTLISLRKQQLAKLDELVKARFVELFGEAENKIPVSEMCNVTGGYSFKSGDISNEGAIKILQIGNVYLDNVSWETINYLPEGFDEKYSKFMLNEGDIVVALTRPIIQSLGNVKACIVKSSDLPCLLNQRVGRIVAKKDKSVFLEFIYGCLMTDDFTRYVESCSIGCSQPNISTKDIENYLIPNATYEEQKAYVEFKKQTDKSKLAVQKSLEKLETLKKALMQKYFG